MSSFLAVLMAARMERGSYRLGSMFSSFITRRTKLNWSEPSKMEKSGRSPMLGPDWRSIRTQVAWKVPIHACSALGPMSRSIRWRISAAALLVKVTARMAWAGTPLASIK